MEEIPNNTRKTDKLAWPTIKWIIVLILILGAGWFIITKSIDWLRPKSWTLFVYTSNTPDTEYQKARIDGYNSKTTCLEKGLELASNKGSYECGYDCRFRDNIGIEVCNKVCGSVGCRD